MECNLLIPLFSEAKRLFRPGNPSKLLLMLGMKQFATLTHGLKMATLN